MNKRVSLKDIAQKVGVSTALVSYVLNNKKEGRIKKEVAQKIRETAKELNYRTNLLARSLKINKTYTIGLIVADIASPFSSGMARIIEDEADKLNYTVIFGSSDENAQKFGKLVDTFLTRQVDGLIIAPPENAENQVFRLRQQGLPFVLFDRYCPSVNTNYVALDNYTAAYNAVKYMIDGGCKRPAIVTYDTTLFHMQERVRGYSAALKLSGIDANKSWIKKVNIINPKAAIEKAVQELLSLDEPADAILFGSNSIAVHGVKYINTLPLKVPKDLAIISFDETESLDLFYASITYIKQPMHEMGQLTTRILLDCIGKNNKVTQVNMQAELVIRASTR
ncbi:LacI family transcriptional regulator [Ilyomonas limi]|uniref:LacI family transcriptional regulator n=1 Tax=Ilyomonas limi TaxID=2575867 RepID=A0A4U3KZJ1_9BACT|nr:LacI family transcriptional regulator [Ilyomonas limi]